MKSLSKPYGSKKLGQSNRFEEHGEEEAVPFDDVQRKLAKRPPRRKDEEE